jgi:hypothetical protein
MTEASTLCAEEFINSGPTIAAKSGAVPAVTIPDDPDLQLLIEAWPRLPEAVRTGIVSMVRSLLGQ